MNERFRFRAWNKTEKKMVSWEELLVSQPNRFFCDPNLEVMQSTGKSDKKEEIIYEGDILLFVTRKGNRNKMFVKWDERRTRFQLVYIPAREEPSQQAMSTRNNNTHRFLIVGNIYE